MWLEGWERDLLLRIARELGARRESGFPAYSRRRSRLFWVRPGADPVIACVSTLHRGGASARRRIRIEPATVYHVDLPSWVADVVGDEEPGAFEALDLTLGPDEDAREDLPGRIADVVLDRVSSLRRVPAAPPAPAWATWR